MQAQNIELFGAHFRLDLFRVLVAYIRFNKSRFIFRLDMFNTEWLRFLNGAVFSSLQVLFFKKLFTICLRRWAKSMKKEKVGTKEEEHI